MRSILLVIALTSLSAHAMCRKLLTASELTTGIGVDGAPIRGDTVPDLVAFVGEIEEFKLDAKTVERNGYTFAYSEAQVRIVEAFAAGPRPNDLVRVFLPDYSVFGRGEGAKNLFLVRPVGSDFEVVTCSASGILDEERRPGPTLELERLRTR